MLPSAIKTLLTSTAVTAYVFPILSGIFITFVTASWIQFQDVRFQATAAMKRLRKRVTLAPWSMTAADWGRENSAALEELREIRDLLKWRGHSEASRKVDMVCADFTEEFLEIYNIEIDRALEGRAFFDEDEAKVARQNALDSVASGIEIHLRLNAFLWANQNRLDRSMFDLQPSWWVIFQAGAAEALIHRLERWGDNLGKNPQSDDKAI